MSWHIGGLVRNSQDIEALKIDDTHGERQGEVEAQVAVAKEAAKAIVASGKVGPEGRQFRVDLSGHASPNHESQPSFGADAITVNIYQYIG